MDLDLREGARKFQPQNYMVIDQICDPSQARVLRTHPPAYLAGKGVPSLEFSGTYPVTRLNVGSFDGDGGLKLALLARHTSGGICPLSAAPQT